MKEALSYLNNAREILKSVPVENGTYIDIKPVREACGTAYPSILIALDEYLLEKEISKKGLPKSVDAYRKALQKYLAVYEGKLLREFEALYEALHIAGYDRGNLYLVNMIKDALKAIRAFIDKIRQASPACILSVCDPIHPRNLNHPKELPNY